jgi:hypothetical protein
VDGRVRRRDAAARDSHVSPPAALTGVLRDTGLDPQYLEIELTENMVMHDGEHMVGTLRAIKQLGVHVAVDDFGTGYCRAITSRSPSRPGSYGSCSRAEPARQGRVPRCAGAMIFLGQLGAAVREPADPMDEPREMSRC